MASYSPDDVDPSSEGHGTLEILEVIKIFEAASIPCCVVGISALNYYGAWRKRRDWEFCVPTDMVEKACWILKSAPYDKVYEQCPHDAPPQIHSLLHTFPRFKLKGYSLYFDSLLDTLDLVGLTGLIDGMNLTEDWGASNLDLSGTNDVAWALEKNEKIRGSVPLTMGSCFFEVDEGPLKTRDLWEQRVRTKQNRIGQELSPEYTTRFRFRDDQDPRLRKRQFA
ncbi:hypothetical protein BKA65DRAFT_609793 [Rhexocercosporidium sp. MPI-PUGE-AT-0058]|nr:hypothetical protein BKA65DRAFT_609793 [Rhexocercosporidium sp. MPI-PUGE-AT-0058]